MTNDKPTYVDLKNQIAELKKQHELLQINFTFQIEEKEKRSAELIIAKEKAEESKKKFKLLYENAPLSYQSLDTNACLVDVNPAWLLSLGYKREEVIGRPFRDFMTSKSAEWVEKRFASFIAEGELHNFQFEMVKKDGTSFWVTYEGKIGYDNFGNFKQTHCIFTDITDRRKAETELIEAKEKAERNEKYYNTIINKIGDPVFVKDDQSRLQLVNDAFCELFDISRSKVIGKTLVENVSPDEMESFLKIDRQVFTDGLENINEETLTISGGETKTILTKKNLFFDKNGTKYLIGFIHDITNRKKEEIELIKAKERAEESKLLFEGLFNNSTVGLYQTTPKGEILSVNPTLIKMLKFDSIEEILKRDLSNGSYLDQEKRNQFKSILAEKGEIIGFESEWSTKDGEIITVVESARVAKDKNGEIIRYDGVVENVTEKVILINELKIAKEKAEESEKNYRKLVETIPDGVYKSTHAGKFVEINPAMVKMLGYNSKEELLAVDIKNDLYIEDSDRDSITLNELNQELGVFRLRKKDESVIWVEDNGWYSFDELGEITSHEGVMRDVTERIRKEQELIIANKELHFQNEEKEKRAVELIEAKEHAEESDRLKSAFLANMSHEIRTPMNAILGFADLLKTPNLSGEKQQEYIRIIEKGGVRMLNIINDIVNISKIESGLMEVNLEESNINEQIEYIYTFFKPEVDAKGINFSFKNTLPLEEAILITDREKLFAILTNLVKNAIKYSERGSIEFGYIVKRKQFEFFIKDTGIGIQKDRQKAIFERFIQADISDKMARQGAGLGLSITKAYVEMLGGQLWLESVEGKGSVFYFTLPYQPEIITEEIVKMEVLSPIEISSTKKLNILIVDDDELSRYLFEEMLENADRKISYAVNGLEAVEICRNNPDIDLILMDMKMPIMDGYEATRQIRQFNKKSFIVAQTAYALEGDKEKAMEAGCNEYLSKPIIPKVLISLIKEHFVS